MKRSLLLVLSILTSTIAMMAQDVRGVVVDSQKLPIMAANVYFVSNPGTGTISDMDGRFSIPFTHESDTLIVSFIGFESRKIPANGLMKNEKNTIMLEIDPMIISEVVILGVTPISEQFSTEKLNSLDIYMNPVSQADPLKAIINMPASTNSDESANPSLRGSASDRSKVIYNGVPIYRPVRASSLNNVGFFSIFNPEMIDVQTVYPSNPPLVTGNASGGIVDISTIKKIDKNTYQFSSGIGNVGFSISQNIRKKSTFVQAYGNWQNSRLLKAINDKSLPDMKSYDTKDAGVNFRYTLGDRAYFNSYNYFMRESYEGTSSMLAYQGDLSSDGTRFFSVNNLALFTRRGIFTANYGYNNEQKDVTFGNNLMDSKDYSHYASVNYKADLGKKLSFQSGVTYDNQNTKVNNDVPLYYYAMSEESPTHRQDTMVSNHILEPYIYLSWDISKKVSMSMGARTNIPIKDQKQYISAQYSLRYQPAENHSIIISAGKYHNYTQPDYYNQKYRLLSSTQVSLDYSYESNHTKIQSALYYKQESGEQDVDFHYTIHKTRTYGLEFSISRTFWNHLSLSFSNSTIKQEVNVNGTTYKGSYHFAYFLKPSITYTHPKLFSLGLMYIGRPGSYVLDYPVRSSRWNPEAKAYEPMYGPLEEFQNNAYHRLDLSASKYMSFNKCALTLYFSINNLLNTKNETNAVYYNMDYSETYRKYHTLRTIYFGLVFSF